MNGTKDGLQAPTQTSAAYGTWLLNELLPAINQHYRWFQSNEVWHDLTTVRSDDERVFVSTDAEHVLIQGTGRATLVFVREACVDRHPDVRDSASGWEVFLR